MPSGPPAEPDGKEDIALAISSVETCSAAKRSELFGSHGVLLSIGADGCLCLSAVRVSGVSNAGLSSLQIRRIADLKSPPSCLLATIDAKNLIYIIYYETLHVVSRVISICCACLYRQ